MYIRLLKNVQSKFISLPFSGFIARTRHLLQRILSLKLYIILFLPIDFT